jgi:hypothetical protein
MLVLATSSVLLTISDNDNANVLTLLFIYFRQPNKSYTPSVRPNQNALDLSLLKNGKKKGIARNLHLKVKKILIYISDERSLFPMRVHVCKEVE